MKDRWVLAAELSPILGTTKTKVFYDILKKMESSNLIERVRSRDQDAIDQVRSWPQFRKDQDESTLTPGEKLKVALWFIEKIGSAEQAMEAVRLGGEAIEKLRNKS